MYQTLRILLMCFSFKYILGDYEKVYLNTNPQDYMVAKSFFFNSWLFTRLWDVTLQHLAWLPPPDWIWFKTGLLAAHGFPAPGGWIVGPKDIHIWIPRTCKCYFICDFADVIKDCVGEIVLGYPNEPSVITGLLIRERQRETWHRRQQCGHCSKMVKAFGFEDGKRHNELQVVKF